MSIRQVYPKSLEPKGKIPFERSLTRETPSQEKSTSYYLTAEDSAQLDQVKDWCREHQMKVKDLSCLGSASVRLSPGQEEEFLENMRKFPQKIAYFKETKISYDAVATKDKQGLQPLGKTPPKDYVLDILNMGKVHNGPLGRFTGKGQTICVIDSGIYPSHPDFLGKDGKSRLKWFVDFGEDLEGTQYANDPMGHGTHMSGTAAGTGKASGGVFARLAPDAELVVLKVENDVQALEAINWVAANHEKYGIDVVSLSISLPARKSYKQDSLCKGVGELIKRGIFVTAAAGNYAKEGTIGTPGIHPDVVTTTALDTHDGKDWNRFTIAESASEGPPPFDPDVHKPNLALPGVNIYGPLAPGSVLDAQGAALAPFGQYCLLSGTSSPCQMAAGMIACINQALKEKGVSLSPAEMLHVLEETAHLIYNQVSWEALSSTRQGSGVPDGFEALKLAIKDAQGKQQKKHSP